MDKNNCLYKQIAEKIKEETGLHAVITDENGKILMRLFEHDGDGVMETREIFSDVTELQDYVRSCCRGGGE